MEKQRKKRNSNKKSNVQTTDQVASCKFEREIPKKHKREFRAAKPNREAEQGARAPIS
jgi:hypothetical protein